MDSYTPSDIKFVKKEISVYQQNDREFTPEKRYIIGIKIGDIIIPHPITDFIDKKYYLESGSINSERSATDILVQFLNYVIKKKIEDHYTFMNTKGISDLTLKHLEGYLEYCGEKGNSRKTVIRKESYLLKFYHFIGIEKHKLKVRPNIQLSNTSYSTTERKRIKQLSATLYYKKPPKNAFNSANIKKKDLVTQQWSNIEDKRDKRLSFIREFLLLASKEFPDIAFAICLQIFGGLRAAECFNLTLHAIKSQNDSEFGERGLILEIRDRQFTLFGSNNALNNDQVKKPRDQAILLDPLVPYLYKRHIEWLKIKMNNLPQEHKGLKNEIALFVNHFGLPMRTHTYRSKFNNLKRTYLGMLSATTGRYEDFKEFRNTNWSTHICRGTFTNLCLDAGFNAVQTAVMRGDSTPEAMYEYTDVLTATQKITQAINLISQEAINSTQESKNTEIFYT